MTDNWLTLTGAGILILVLLVIYYLLRVRASSSSPREPKKPSKQDREKVEQLTKDMVAKIPGGDESLVRALLSQQTDEETEEMARLIDKSGYHRK